MKYFHVLILLLYIGCTNKSLVKVNDYKNIENIYPKLGIYFSPKTIKIYDNNWFFKLINLPNPEVIYSDYVFRYFSSIIQQKTKFIEVRRITDSLPTSVDILKYKNPKYLEIKRPTKEAILKLYEDKLDYILVVYDYTVTGVVSTTYITNSKPSHENYYHFVNVQNELYKDSRIPRGFTIQNSAKIMVIDCHSNTIIEYGLMNININANDLDKEDYFEGITKFIENFIKNSSLNQNKRTANKSLEH